MKEISLLKLKPTKQLWNLNPSMKELFYTLEPEGETAPVDSLLSYDEGEDVTFKQRNQNQKQSQNRLNRK
jgi:hypothetical protein